MKVSGITEVALTAITLTELQGVEARCAETLVPLDPKEKVIVFAEGVMSEDGKSVIVDPAIRLIKSQSSVNGSNPLEDFVSRYLNNVAHVSGIPATEITEEKKPDVITEDIVVR